MPSAAAALQRHGARFDADEIAAVERGEAVVRPLGTQDSRDVAVLGIVRLAMSREVYLRRLQDFRAWRAPAGEQVGLFRSPASLADVASLQVSKKDASDLKKCRAGSCTTKLPVLEMQRVQAQVDWSANDVPAQVSTLARQRLVRLVEEYRERGNAALPPYEDREPTVHAGEAADAVLAQSAFLQQVAPSVASHFRDYPRNRLPGATELFYWSENVVPRLRPILSLTHAVIHSPPDAAGWTLIASKQLYANHYFEAALELHDVVDRAVPAESPGGYLLIERRFRFDNLPRGGILNIRGRAVNGLRDQLLRDLQRERGIPLP